MREKQAKEQIKKAGKTWEDFMHWMRGQTLSAYENGDTNFYDDDVDRFCRNKSSFRL